MARKPDSQASKDAILEAATLLIMRSGSARISVDAVAKQAGVAKGLVHYHFKTKKGLFERVARHLGQRRREAWERAFQADDPQEAIDATWNLLTNESTNGTLTAWAMLFGSTGMVPEQVVKEEADAFGAALGTATERMLARLGLRPSIPVPEVGTLLSAMVQGMGTLLVRGSAPGNLHGAYAAGWLGVLSLTRR